ncbi:hypothetical protein AA3271_0032 [Gluconobacter japonicus NBRC 3271]|nr:hypothetical protein AA3271_0032 [Gluconobacter japonicus NBRC 3271]
MLSPSFPFCQAVSGMTDMEAAVTAAATTTRAGAAEAGAAGARATLSDLIRAEEDAGRAAA